MNLGKTVIYGALLFTYIWIGLKVVLNHPIDTTQIFGSIAVGIMLSLIFVGWLHAALVLYDDEHKLLRYIAYLITGYIGLATLLKIREYYRKNGYTFLSDVPEGALTPTKN